MEKRTIRYNWIHCRKWIATWTVLVLVFSLIPVSTGSENYIERAGSGNYTDSKIVAYKDEQNGESTGESLEVEEDLGDGADDQETDIEQNVGNAEEDPQVEEDPGDGIDGQETGIEQDGESTEESLEVEGDIGDSADDQETNIENFESGAEESNIADDQIPEGNFGIITGKEQNTDIQESIGDNPEVQTGAKDGISNQNNIQENSETKITAETGTDTQQNTNNQERPEKNQETEEIDSCSTVNLESTCIVPTQKKETGKKPECREGSESVQKSKTNVECLKDDFENPGTGIQIKTEPCDGLKTIENVEVETEPEGETCSEITNFKSEGSEPETTIEARNEENFAGTYEKGTDPTGVSQTEVSVRDVKRSTRTGIKQESYISLSMESQNPSTLRTGQSDLDAAGLLGIKGLESQIRKEALQAKEVVKEPSKLASFLVTFVGTLLIGFIILRRRY